MAQVAGFAWIRLDISDFPTRHNYGLALRQNHIERILAGWVDELAVPIYRGRRGHGFRAGRRRRRRRRCPTASRCGREYLVGCDGGRSLIRKAAGIEFPGWDPTISNLIAEVEMTEEPELGLRRDAHGIARHRARLEDGSDGRGHADRAARRPDRRTHPARPQRGTHRRRTGPTSGSTARRGSRGSPTRLGRPRPIGRDACCWPATPRTCITRPAAGPQHRRAGRGESGLEAGPGRQGDLAREPPRHVPSRTAPGRCPRPAATRWRRSRCCRTDDRTEALREIMSELLRMDEPRTRIAAMMSGLDVHYDLGEGHPLLGRRMPDLDLVTAGWPAAGLHPAARAPARPSQPRRARRLRHHPWADRVQLVDATSAVRGSFRCSGRSVLPPRC